MKRSKSYEQAQRFLHKVVEVTIDRPLGTKHPKFGFEYPINYGELKKVEAPDGGGLDAYILGISEPLEHFIGEVIAIVHRNDDDDDKLVVVRERDTNWSDEEIMKEVSFQEQWFDSGVLRH